MLQAPWTNRLPLPSDQCQPLGDGPHSCGGGSASVITDRQPMGISYCPCMSQIPTSSCQTKNSAGELARGPILSSISWPAANPMVYLRRALNIHKDWSGDMHIDSDSGCKFFILHRGHEINEIQSFVLHLSFRELCQEL
jgi:hypothetical protein